MPATGQVELRCWGQGYARDGKRQGAAAWVQEVGGRASRPQWLATVAGTCCFDGGLQVQRRMLVNGDDLRPKAWQLRRGDCADRGYASTGTHQLLLVVLQEDKHIACLQIELFREVAWQSQPCQLAAALTPRGLSERAALPTLERAYWHP